MAETTGKQTREVYRGKAVIMNVKMLGAEDWKEWERRDLSEADLSNAFKIVYDVAEGDANGNRHDIDVEVSRRELRGKMLDYYKRENGTTPTQIDVAIRTLERQGIVKRNATEADLVDAVDEKKLVGRTVTIRAYEELGKDGATWWPRCAFASARSLITGGDMASRMAAFIAGKPAPKPSATVAQPKASAMPPAPADDDDVPF